MNIQEIYELGIAQGWDEDDAYYLAQIAWAESGGDPYVMEYLPDNDPDKQYSFGIWQINLQHIQNLIDAGIGDWPEGWPESITGSTDLFYPDDVYGGGMSDGVLSVIQDVMANAVTNAEAAWYVGHRMDYSDPWDDWDWTRWNTTELPETDNNHPSNYGSDIIRTTVLEDAPAAGAEVPEDDWFTAVVPDDFRSMMTAESGWNAQMLEWGVNKEQEEAVLRWLWKRYNEYLDVGDGTVASWMEEAKEQAALAEVGDLFGPEGPLPAPPAPSPPYAPTMGHLPEGWLKFWADDDTDVGEWFRQWEDTFEENRQRAIPYEWDDMEDDFLADLYKQAWWVSKTDNYRRLVQFWYSGGGPGGQMTDGVWEPGAGWAAPPATPGYVQSPASSGPGAEYQGTGDWQAIWDASKEVSRSIAEDLGIPLDSIPDSELNNMAWMLMRDGGAANFYNPTETWADTAAAMIERYVIDNFFDADGNLKPALAREGRVELVAGTITEIMDTLRNRANSQLYDIEESELRTWAMEIKSERGKNLAQRIAEIDALAYAQWGLTPDAIEGMGSWNTPEGSPGSTMSGLVNPLWNVATKLWEDNSILKNDPWLMDNYQVTAEDGTKRFRTGPEMRDVARANLDRFQNSSQYQDPMNKFILGAARMFRSDY